ncbi:hypothetical protein DL765_005377 [Monosporascus sp. GIB2]|nr:hypothetical protein DL765_005377 [Monosporascus sp. GIB2]
MSQTVPTKKDIYFNFGPNESYFVKYGPQHRSSPGGFPRSCDRLVKDSGGSGKFDCVAWKTESFFACSHSEYHINRNVAEAMPRDFESWMNKRALCPLRVTFGEPRGSWFAWMLHGDFIFGHNVPQGMWQAARDVTKASTCIRIAAIGPNDTWLLIWEDGTMISVLNNEYEDLKRKLAEHKVDDISWVALNPFRMGDYFLYVDKKKMATFQVSEAFGMDLKSVLESQGIDTRELVFREQQVDKPRPSITSHFKNADFVGAARSNIKIDGDALLNAAASFITTGLSVGTVLIGTATCNVM